MAHSITHPINDSALVSYHRPELIRLIPQLEQAEDCWTLLNGEGLGEAKKKYLPKEEGEPSGAYEARLNRSTYTPIYRDSIRSYAGLLSRFNLIDAPPSFEENKSDVDLQGSSVQSFMTKVDELALRDGGTFIWVDIMPDNGADNFYDQLTDGRHPYFINVKRCDVISWQVSYNRGVESVDQAVIRQLKAVPDEKGYGSRVEPVYYVLTPGKVEEYQVIQNKGEQKYRNKLISTWEVSSRIVPLVWYGATTTRFGQGDLPMDGLADLSIEHFQMRSDLKELLHKCAMPVPVRKGATLGPDGKPIPLVLGPNSAVDVPTDGSFGFAEPSGKSLERHQAEIKHNEELMDRSSLNFLYGANVKTATEASLRASQVASSVSSLIRNKTAAFGRLLKLWAVYAGQEKSLTAESGIAINDALINKPLGASEMAQMVNLYTNELMSKKTTLDELQRGGVLDPDLVVADEIRRIEEEHKKQQAQQHKDNEQKLQEDLKRASEFQKQAPAQPGQDVDEKPKERDPKTEQEKTTQAAKVAQ